jgi:hypothetical protein
LYLHKRTRNPSNPWKEKSSNFLIFHYWNWGIANTNNYYYYNLWYDTNIAWLFIVTYSNESYHAHNTRQSKRIICWFLLCYFIGFVIYGTRKDKIKKINEWWWNDKGIRKRIEESIQWKRCMFLSFYFFEIINDITIVVYILI